MTDAQKCPEITGMDKESGVSAFNGKPFVRFSLTFADGSEKTITQFTVEEARAQGRDWFEAAEAAEMDSMMMRFVREKLEQEPAAAAQIVAELREYRDQK